MLLLCGAVSACGKVQASTPAPMPALAIPEPPERQIVPLPIPEPPPEPSPTPLATPPARPPAPTPVTRPAERQAPPPASTPVPEPTPSPTALVLQTTPNVGELEKTAQAQLAAAKRDLEKVTYKTLSADARLQYDTARQYIGQAEDALKIKNFVFAGQLAEKAAVLASLLVKSQGKTISVPTSV